MMPVLYLTSCSQPTTVGHEGLRLVKGSASMEDNTRGTTGVVMQTFTERIISLSFYSN